MCLLVYRMRGQDVNVQQEGEIDNRRRTLHLVETRGGIPHGSDMYSVRPFNPRLVSTGMASCFGNSCDLSHTSTVNQSSRYKADKRRSKVTVVEKIQRRMESESSLLISLDTIHDPHRDVPRSSAIWSSTVGQSVNQSSIHPVNQNANK